MESDYGDDSVCIYCARSVYECTCTFPENSSILTKVREVNPKDKIIKDLKEKIKEINLIIEQL